MPTFDIFIICVIALPAIIGVFYGFLNIVFSVLSWGVAFSVSIKLLPVYTPLVGNYIETDLLRTVLTFAGLFITCLTLSGLTFYFIVKLMGRMNLTASNRLLGLLFGMGLGGIIVATIVFLGGFTFMPQEAWWQRSKLVEPFERISIWCHGFLPDAVAQHHSYEAMVNYR